MEKVFFILVDSLAKRCNKTKTKRNEHIKFWRSSESLGQPSKFSLAFANVARYGTWPWQRLALSECPPPVLIYDHVPRTVAHNSPHLPLFGSQTS